MAAQVTTPGISLATIVPLNGNNYKKWRAELDLYFAMQDIDWCLSEDAPNPITDDSTAQEGEHFRLWTRANRMCRLIAMRTMTDTVKGSIPENENAKAYLESVAERFKESEKAEASMLLDNLTNMKYTSAMSIREYIMQMIEISAKLAELNMPLDDHIVVHMALKSLPAQFNSLKTTYNTQKDKWTLNELIAVCVQEEERIKKDKEVTIHLVTKPQWKSAKGKSKSYVASTAASPIIKKNGNWKKKSFKCFFCKKEGYMKKDCEKYKNWVVKKGVRKQEGAKEA